jgi:hypothetical protein
MDKYNNRKFKLWATRKTFRNGTKLHGKNNNVSQTLHITNSVSNQREDNINLKAYVSTKASVKFQTSSFQIKDALTDQKAKK